MSCSLPLSDCSKQRAERIVISRVANVQEPVERSAGIKRVREEGAANLMHLALDLPNLLKEFGIVPDVIPGLEDDEL